MTRIKINNLIWDEWNLEHVKKHGLSKKIVEKAILNIRAFRYGYKRRIILICDLKDNVISIVVDRKADGKYYVASARISSRRERKIKNEKNK